MYEIEFYETEDGKCPIWDFLELYASRLLPIKMHGYSTNRQASTLSYFSKMELT